jgi:hypothetical protein
MPISAAKRRLYPKMWAAISRLIRFGRADSRCECTGGCGDHHLGGRCEERHGQQAFSFSGEVRLATAHLDHDPRNNRSDNLAALCQRCHIRHDRWHQAASRKRTRRRRMLDGAVQLCLILLPRPLTGVQLSLPLFGANDDQVAAAA